MSISSVDVEGSERLSFGGVYVVLPSVLCFVLLIILFLLKMVNLLKGWGVFVLVLLLGFLLFWGVSVFFYVVRLLGQKSRGVEGFNSPDFCKEHLKEHIKRDTGYVVEDYSCTGDSTAGVGYFGEGGGEMVYHHLFRINEPGHKRYLLAAMNMERGRENVVCIKQSPMNFSDLGLLIDRVCNGLVKKPVRYSHKTRVVSDVFGQKELEESEEKPFTEEEDEE